MIRRRLSRLIMLLATLCLASTAGALTREEINSLFRDGNNLFRQANQASLNNPAAARDLYRRAALRFERIVEEGEIRNGKLFYDIGNTYFRAGDIGRAILNYRRAALYTPEDPNLKHNLEYARHRRVDKFEEKQEKRVLKTLLFFHYDFSRGLRLALLTIFSGLFWIGATARIARARWAPRTLLVLSGILALLFAGSLAAESYANSRQQPGVILAQQVIARIGDGVSYEPAFKEPLHAGAEFTVVETRGNWRHIELPDGRRCWIPVTAAGLVNAI